MYSQICSKILKIYSVIFYVQFYVFLKFVFTHDFLAFFKDLIIIDFFKTLLSSFILTKALYNHTKKR